MDVEQKNLLPEGQEPKKAEHIYTNSRAGIKPTDVELEQQLPQKTRTGRIVKLSTKVQEAKTYTSDQNHLCSLQDTDVKYFIVELTQLLGNWEENARVLLITKKKPLFI